MAPPSVYSRRQLTAPVEDMAAQLRMQKEVGLTKKEAASGDPEHAERELTYYWQYQRCACVGRTSIHEKGESDFQPHTTRPKKTASATTPIRHPPTSPLSPAF